MKWMVKYQAEKGLIEIYFESLDEAIDWQSKHEGSELWEKKYS